MIVFVFELKLRCRSDMFNNTQKLFGLMEMQARRIIYAGNKNTNKYKNNVEVRLNPFYTEKDTVTMIDLYNKKRSSNIQLTINRGVPVLSTHHFYEHTGELCLIQQLTGNEYQAIGHNEKRTFHQYLIISNSDVMKPVLLLTILDYKVTEVFKNDA